MSAVTYAQAWSDHVITAGDPAAVVTVNVLSGDTVFYGDRNVTSSNNQGSLTVGQSVQVPSGQSYGLRSASQSYVQLVGQAVQTQAVRVNAGAFTVSQTRDVTITWPTPFADANYTALAILVDAASTANANALRQIVGLPTASGFTVRVAAGTTGYSSGQLLIHAIGIHD